MIILLLIVLSVSRRDLKMSGVYEIIASETCNSCKKSIDCYNTDHGNNFSEDNCPIDNCEKCDKPIHHLECMAIIDWVPSSGIWCDPCFDEYWLPNSITLRIGRTLNGSENGGYQTFGLDRTIGEIIYELNYEYNTRERIEEDEQLMLLKFPDILKDFDDDLDNDYIDSLTNKLTKDILDIKYPQRNDFMGRYSYSHWFGIVTLKLWDVRFTGHNTLLPKPFIHTREPTTTLRDIVRELVEGDISR